VWHPIYWVGVGVPRTGQLGVPHVVKLYLSFETNRTNQLKEKRKLQRTTMADDYKCDICGRVCGSMFSFFTHSRIRRWWDSSYQRLSLYCNDLLAGAPQRLLDRLQSVLNADAKLLSGFGMYDHVTPLMWDRLQWLPVSHRVFFKLSQLTCRELYMRNTVLHIVIGHGKVSGVRTVYKL